VKRQTIQRVAAPTAMLVGLAEDVANLCDESLADNGIRVLRVSHLAAASERIPVVMPQLVIVPAELGIEDSDTLNDRCVAVGADILRVDERPDRRALQETLRLAGQKALVRAFRS
jgi:hypothetical protein